MFKNKKKVDSEIIQEEGLRFPVKQKCWKIMQINYDGKEIETRPYLSTKEERAIRIKERKVLLETESIGNAIIK